MINTLSELLNKYFIVLEENSIDYCVIGNYSKLPEFTENDVDFWVSDVGLSEKLLLSLAQGIGLRLYMQNKTANGTNNYFYKNIDGDPVIVKVDLMHETAYKSIVSIVMSDLIKDNRVKYKNFYVANEVVEGVMHLLYPLVTFGIVKEKYKKKIVGLSNSTEFSNCICSILGERLGADILVSIQGEDWGEVEKKSSSIRMHLFLRSIRDFNLKRLRILSYFIYSIVYRIINRNGLVIGFTGIDGAGKTSIKEYLINNADKFFTKNRKSEFYWRPFLLPRISKVVGSKGQNEVYDCSGKRVVGSNIVSRTKNIFKYLYYVSDFILGQVNYIKKSNTGGLVVFDRYHLDNIVYPERFGFNLDKRVMRFIDKYVVPQPDILFYFTADTTTLYERKHEIDIDEINHQKLLYQSEIKLRNDVETICTNKSFEESVNEVLLKCLEKMSKKYE